MFKFLYRIAIAFAANLVALWIASRYITGFQISSNWQDFLYVTAIFTLLYIFLRPVLKLFFGPVIVLTLGIGLLFINVLVLYLLQSFTDKVAITGLVPMIYASLIIGLVNFLFHLFPRGKD